MLLSLWNVVFWKCIFLLNLCEYMWPAGNSMRPQCGRQSKGSLLFLPFLASHTFISYSTLKCNPWKCGVYKKNATIRYSFNHFVLARKRNIRKTCSLNLGLDVLAILSGGQWTADTVKVERGAIVWIRNESALLLKRKGPKLPKLM